MKKKINLHAKHFYYHEYIHLIDKKNARLKITKSLNIKFLISDLNVKFKFLIFIQFCQLINHEDTFFHFYNQMNNK